MFVRIPLSSLLTFVCLTAMICKWQEQITALLMLTRRQLGKMIFVKFPMVSTAWKIECLSSGRKAWLVLLVLEAWWYISVPSCQVILRRYCIKVLCVCVLGWGYKMALHTRNELLSLKPSPKRQGGKEYNFQAHPHMLSAIQLWISHFVWPCVT